MWLGALLVLEAMIRAVARAWGGLVGPVEEFALADGSRYRCRLATPADIPRLGRLERLLAEHEAPLDRTIVANATYYDIESLVTDPAGLTRLVVIESVGGAAAAAAATVVACGYVQRRASQRFKRHSHHGALNFMVVDPAHRGRGLNRRLIDFAVAEGRVAWGAGLEFYLVGVYTGNVPAHRAYRKAGFASLVATMRLESADAPIAPPEPQAAAAAVTVRETRFSLASGAPAICRLATRADIPALKTLEAQLVAFERPFDRTIKGGDPRGLYYDLEALVADPTGATRFVVIETLAVHPAGGVAKAHACGEIIACGYVQHRPSVRYKRHRHHGYLGFMFVDPAHRGNRLNGRIIDFAVAAARAAWGVGLEFYLEVYTENTSATRAYQKAGLRPVLDQMLLEHRGAGR